MYSIYRAIRYFWGAVAGHNTCLEGEGTITLRKSGETEMTEQQQTRKPAGKAPQPVANQCVSTLKANLKRLEVVLKSPYVRPVDFATRDRLARKLREAKKLRA